jgi:hypothetical protein
MVVGALRRCRGVGGGAPAFARSLRRFVSLLPPFLQFTPPLLSIPSTPSIHWEESVCPAKPRCVSYFTDHSYQSEIESPVLVLAGEADHASIAERAHLRVRQAMPCKAACRPTSIVTVERNDTSPVPTFSKFFPRAQTV